MAEKEIVLTPQGLKALERKLDYYKTHHRREVAERIRQAKEFGEIGENSEYEDAKSEQAFIEGEIANLENIIRHARILDSKEIDTDLVSLGATIKIRNMESKANVEYTIVGSTEADPANGRISNESPVGSALLGRTKGDVVEIPTPGGVVKYKIVQIKKMN